METQAVEIIETEIPLEKAMSLNHSRLTVRIAALLLPHENRYDVLAALDLDLRTGRAKPDVALIATSRCTTGAKTSSISRTRQLPPQKFFRLLNRLTTWPVR